MTVFESIQKEIFSFYSSTKTLFIKPKMLPLRY